jgi:glutaredoxin
MFGVLKWQVVLIGVVTLLVALVVVLSTPVVAQENTVIDFFYSPTCHHCTKESSFLDELKEQYPEIELRRHNLSERDNSELLSGYYDKYQVFDEKRGFVPVTFLGDRHWVGYDESVGREMERYITHPGIEILTEGVAIDQSSQSEISDGEGKTAVKEKSELSLPFIGLIDISRMGLLTLTILIGVLDGFNACAMWALFFLLTFLVASGSRKRVFLIGGTFIFVSGLVYFLFITAWLNLFLLIGYLKIIQIIISVVAIIFGLVCVKDYFAFGEGFSFIIPKAIRDRIVDRMKKLSGPSLALPATLLGVALLATGVNLVEIICTTGFPVVFTNLLSAHQLSTSSYYFYLLVYILFYMLDDFAVFSVVVLTLGARPLPDKYKRVSKLVSGAVLIMLGLVMLFKPELLMFG